MENFEEKLMQILNALDNLSKYYCYALLVLDSKYKDKISEEFPLFIILTDEIYINEFTMEIWLWWDKKYVDIRNDDIESNDLYYKYINTLKIEYYKIVLVEDKHGQLENIKKFKSILSI